MIHICGVAQTEATVTCTSYSLLPLIHFWHPALTLAHTYSHTLTHTVHAYRQQFHTRQICIIKIMPSFIA